MSNYKIEGNIDFYKELYESLDNNSDDETKDEQKKVCLITGSDLTDKFVTLECSHTFNYITLYTEICKQKFEFQSYTSDVLSNTDFKKMKNSNIDYYIKCPYCRKIQFTLLPYYEELELPKKYGVNTNDTDYRVIRTSYHDRCPSLSISNGSNGSYVFNVYGHTFKKGTCCKFSIVNNKQIPCYNIYSTQITAPDGTIKTFCPNHVKEAVKKYKIEIQTKKLEEKMKAKELKQKEKEEKLKAKEINQKEKEEIKLAKQAQKLEKDESEPKQLCVGCNIILKSGPRKGSECGNKIHENNMCKRHYTPNTVS
jgi:hypothetical protein